MDSTTGARLIQNIKPPKYLYHWTTLKALAAIAGTKDGSEPWTQFADLRRRKNGKWSGFYTEWAPLANKNYGGLFTWTHPILAMKGGEFENYGEILVRIEVDTENARAVEVQYGKNAGLGIRVDNNGVPLRQLVEPVDVSNIDLVYSPREWVIIDPKAIKSFTADIDTLRPVLELELQRLKDPNYIYKSEDIHFEDFKRGGYVRDAYYNYAVWVIESLLRRTDPNSIPSYFRRDSDGQFVAMERYVTGAEIAERLAQTEMQNLKAKEDQRLESDLQTIMKRQDTLPGNYSYTTSVDQMNNLEREFRIRFELHIRTIAPMTNTFPQIYRLIPKIDDLIPRTQSDFKVALQDLRSNDLFGFMLNLILISKRFSVFDEYQIDFLRRHLKVENHENLFANRIESDIRYKPFRVLLKTGPKSCASLSQ